MSAAPDGAVAGLRGLRCLVLGGGGFLGRALISALQESGAEVSGFGRSPPPRFQGGPQGATLHWTQAALTDAAAVADAVRQQDVVFHLASSSLPENSNRDPAGDILDSVVPTIKLLDLCHAAKISKVVFASSGGTVYGIPSEVPTPEHATTDPISAYGINKLTVERYLGLYKHLYGLNYQVLRISNPYGPGQSPFKKQGVVAVMMHRALSGEALELWGTGEVTRDFIHVSDVCSAFLVAALYRGPYRIMNVGSGEGRSLNRIAADVAKTLNRPGLDLVRRPARAADVPVSVLDIGLIRRETDWRPRVQWDTGLETTADWLRREFSL